MGLKYRSDEQYEAETIDAGIASVGFATVEVASMAGFSSKTVTANTTTNIKASAGVFHSMNISQISCPTILIYDSALPSGTVIHTFHPGSPSGNYIFDVNFDNGLTFDALEAGVAPQVQVSYR